MGHDPLEARGAVRTIVYAGQVIGHVAAFSRHSRREVGYWISREFWGQGLAAAALMAFLAVVPTRPPYARVAHDNAASTRVLEVGGFRAPAVERAFAHARGAEMDERLYARG